MAKTHVPYAPEFRRQMVELVRAGRDPADLAREFEPSSQAIRNWVAQADRQEGRREGKPAAVADSLLNTAEREELARLRRENKQLKLELQYKVEDERQTCFDLEEPPAVPNIAYVGFTAETGELSDNHDIISVAAKNLYTQPGSGGNTGGFLRASFSPSLDLSTSDSFCPRFRNRVGRLWLWLWLWL